MMRTIVVNTGTELLLGDVLNTHLTFIAREIFEFGLRVEEQRTVPDGRAIRETLADVFPRAEIVFVTGGLGPTSDDITRELAADLLRLELREDPEIREAIRSRLAARKIPTTDRIWRQALVPQGGQAFINENGTAPGIYLHANLNPDIPSPHLFLLPGPPRELEPMFRRSIAPALRAIAVSSAKLDVRKFRLANIGESIVEKKVGAQLLAIPGLELGYCARPGEVEVRVLGSADAVAEAEKIMCANLAEAIFTIGAEDLAEVIVRKLAAESETIALAESCTGGFLAHRITNVAGSSQVFLAGSVTYSNEEKIRALGVSGETLEKFGAVSEEVAREMAEGIRKCAGATHSLATTGIAGPTGGSAEKPVGTVYISLASENQPTICKKLLFLTDRQTFKQMVAQNAFDLLRKRL